DVASIGTIEEQTEFRKRWIESITPELDENVLPHAREIEEAKRNPGGWVYRIAGQFDAGSDVPPEAIIGAWTVSAQGVIVGPFVKNPNYDALRWPVRKVH